jgi:hypothetical protein
VVTPTTCCSSFDPHEVAHGLVLVRNLLAISDLSDHTRSFLHVFLTWVHDDWNRIDFAGVNKMESQLVVCLKSPDVLKSLREASSTLCQTFHIDLPDYVYLADTVDHYDLIPRGMGGLSPTIITPTIPLEAPCTSRLHTTPNPRFRSRLSKLTVLLRLLHRPGSRTAAPFSSGNLPSGFNVKINKFLAKPENGSLVKDVTSQLEIYHGLEVEIEATSADQGKTPHFAVAIERWSVWSRQEIIETCRIISKEDVLNFIATSLAPSRSAAADVIGTSSVIKIDLFEPFSQSRIFDIPVRGANCLHHDAFDLRVFLETRSKPFSTDRPPLNDWRCPICSSECTPGQLFKDGFLVEVREHLRAKDQLNTRSIIVDHGGNWKRVIEDAAHAVFLDAEL